VIKALISLAPPLIGASLLLASMQEKEEPYSCRMYHEAERKCSYNTIGKCYLQSEVDRLRQQCLRDGGRT
jgi:hypothetical protein